ncbi:MAG: hypothetical protein RLZZ324_1172 [Candidatus Parcubacteria bacterium]|jgi:O-antigen ligase
MSLSEQPVVHHQDGRHPAGEHPLDRASETFDIQIDPHRRGGKRNLFALLASAAIIAGLVVAIGPWKAFGAVASLAVIGAAFLRPDMLLLFLAAYTPFEPFLLKFVPDDLYLYARYFSEGLIYVLAASVMYRVLTRRAKVASTPLDLPFLFFMLIAVASFILNAVPLTIGILGIRQIVRFILIFFLVTYLAPEEKFIRKVTSVMLGVMLFQGLLGLAQAVTGGAIDIWLIPSQQHFYESIQLTAGTEQTWSPGTRVFATMGRYDQLGTFLCFFLLIAAGLLYRMKAGAEKQRLFWCALLVLPALVLTLSRASWFGWILGMLAIGAWFMKDSRVRLAVVGVAALAVLYAVWSGIAVTYLTDYPSQTPVERFFEAFSYERWRGEYYGLGRVYWIVQTPLVVVRSSPLFGVGPGQYGGGAAAALGNTDVYQKLNLPFGVYGTDGYIDNNWFSLWGETGTLGVFFYAWMMLALLRMAYRTARQATDPYLHGLALGFMGCVLAVAFQAFLGTYFEVRTIALYLWMYGGFVYALARRERLAL